MPPKFSFKKNIQFDIALLAEVESRNPFAFKVAKQVWRDVASKLANSELKMSVTDRSCRERVELLLKNFSKDENISLKASGITEEEMNTLKKLLTSVSELAKQKWKTGSNMYSKASRKEGESIQEEALSNILEEGIVEDECDVTEGSKGTTEVVGEETNVKQSPKSESQPPKMRMKPENELIKYLENKNKAEIDLKREELDIRRLEAENKKKEMDAVGDRMCLEMDIRKQELVLQKERQDAEIEEKKRFSELLMKLLPKNN